MYFDFRNRVSVAVAAVFSFRVSLISGLPSAMNFADRTNVPIANSLPCRSDHRFNDLAIWTKKTSFDLSSSLNSDCRSRRSRPGLLAAVIMGITHARSLRSRRRTAFKFQQRRVEPFALGDEALMLLPKRLQTRGRSLSSLALGSGISPPRTSRRAHSSSISAPPRALSFFSCISLFRIMPSISLCRASIRSRARQPARSWA